MVKDFHKIGFDEETELKLDIFRHYIRNWLPVFLSKITFSEINVIDFFSGPGYDSQGRKGSPLIIIEEVEKYLTDPKNPKGNNIKIFLHFNEYDRNKFSQLENNTKSFINNPLFQVCIESKDFKESFQNKINILKNKDTANLVILDQFGFKHITKEVFKELTSCSATDILFFVSSSTLKRFLKQEGIRKYFPNLTDEAIRGINPYSIHRFVCEYYRKLIPEQKEYYVAPFSIKKGRNIYGLIFGSGSLFGLEKFLDVCWNQDQVIGEANYNIDDDFARDEPVLIPELNVIHKQDKFKKELIDKIKKESPNNNDLYKYCLENGFLPKHVNEIFRKLQKEGVLKVFPESVRSGAYYINWENYKNNEVKASFKIVT